MLIDGEVTEQLPISQCVYSRQVVPNRMDLMCYHSIAS